MTDEYFRILDGKLNSLQKNIDRMQRDFDEERNNYYESLVRLGVVAEGVQALLKGQNAQAGRIADKVEDKVSEAVQPILEQGQSMQEEAQDLKKTIIDKTIKFRNKFKEKHFWQIWR